MRGGRGRGRGAGAGSQPCRRHRRPVRTREASASRLGTMGLGARGFLTLLALGVVLGVALLKVFTDSGDPEGEWPRGRSRPASLPAGCGRAESCASVGTGARRPCAGLRAAGGGQAASRPAGPPAEGASGPPLSSGARRGRAGGRRVTCCATDDRPAARLLQPFPEVNVSRGG